MRARAFRASHQISLSPFYIKTFYFVFILDSVWRWFSFLEFREKSVQWLFAEWAAVWLITTISSVVASCRCVCIHKYMCDVSINKEDHYIVSISPQKLHTVNACHLFCTRIRIQWCVLVLKPNSIQNDFEFFSLLVLLSVSLFFLFLLFFHPPCSSHNSLRPYMCVCLASSSWLLGVKIR